MNAKKQPVRIDLTAEQRKQIREATGQEPTALEFTVEELEERIAPVSFNYSKIEFIYQ